MNIKNLFVFATIFVGTALSNVQVLKINNYQYACGNEQHSILGKLGLGSFRALFYSSSEVCNSNQIYGGNYIKFHSCLNINGYQTMFSIDENGNINKTFYNDVNCNQGFYNQITTIPGECVNDCKGTPYDYSIVDLIDIEHPENTVVGISYGGSCNNNWKDNFLFSTFYYTQKCINLGIISATISCNSTLVIEEMSSSTSCLNSQYQNSFKVGTECNNPIGNTNIVTICSN